MGLESGCLAELRPSFLSSASLSRLNLISWKSSGKTACFCICCKQRRFGKLQFSIPMVDSRKETPGDCSQVVRAPSDALLLLCSKPDPLRAQRPSADGAKEPSLLQSQNSDFIKNRLKPKKLLAREHCQLSPSLLTHRPGGWW